MGTHIVPGHIMYNYIPEHSYLSLTLYRTIESSAQLHKLYTLDRAFGMMNR